MPYTGELSTATSPSTASSPCHDIALLAADTIYAEARPVAESASSKPAKVPD